MNHESDPIARRATAGLEDSGEHVGVRLHTATAHPREVEQRDEGTRDSVEADSGVPGKWVTVGGLREGLKDGVYDHGGAENRCRGEKEIGEMQLGSDEVLPSEVAAAAAPCPWFWAWSWGKGGVGAWDP